MEAGISIAADKNAGTRFTLAPAIGMLIPAGRKYVDLGLRFYTVPMGYSFPEQKPLLRGGYSFLGQDWPFYSKIYG